MIMRGLVAFSRGCMLAVGITLPKPEQEKAVAVIWVLAFLGMAAIVVVVSWLVLASMSSGIR